MNLNHVPLSDIEFSIVVPLYNKQNFIQKTIQSVLSQSHSMFQLIVVDDESTDRSAEIVRSFNDPRIELVQKKNGGEGAARNTGVEHARNEWVAFLDADDWWFTNHLSELSTIIAQCPKADLIATSMVTNIFGTPDPHMPSSPLANVRYVDYFAEMGDRQGLVWSSSSAIRKSVFKLHEGFKDHKVGADTEYWARIALDHEVALSSRQTSVYMLGTGGISDQRKLTKSSNQVVKTASQLGPVVELLANAALNPNYADKHVSIMKYLNARVTLSVVGALYNGNPSAAKNLVTLYQGQLKTSQKLISGIKFVPMPILSFGAKMAKRAKKLLREGKASIQSMRAR